MNRIANWKITLVSLALLGSPTVLTANELDAVDGPNVRVMKNEDGSETIFTRSPDKRTITKKTYSNGNLSMVTVYRMDEHGNPMSCKIFDGQNTELFKVSYGYHKADGLLMAEYMFDSRTKRIDPNTGKEMPVHRFNYVYDANGKRSAPISMTLIPGRDAKDVFGRAPSGTDANPFLQDEGGAKPANPNARGVGRRN